MPQKLTLEENEMENELAQRAIALANQTGEAVECIGLADIPFSIAPGTNPDTIPHILREALIEDLVRRPREELHTKLGECVEHNIRSRKAHHMGLGRFVILDIAIQQDPQFQLIVTAMERQIVPTMGQQAQAAPQLRPAG